MIKEFLNAIIGEPLPNEKTSHEKYNVPFGLAVMASDAISSVAYAAEEILTFLIPVIGLMSYIWLGWISLMIIGLLFILTISYIQIIRAYPQGGGAYVVAKENIGVKPGLVAASSLLVDYILTVAVSSSAGIAAIVSAFPSLAAHKIFLVISIIIILTILNLRGVSESSKIFSIPTYMFLFGMLFMIIYGLIKCALYGAPPANVINAQLKVSGEISVYLILRAFSNGCSALTGIEAVSNSVPNFKEPSQKNAKTVMILLSALIFLIFGGTSLLARFYHAIPTADSTVLSQIATGVFGKTFMYYFIQLTTAIILFMACNTAFTGFPMLMYVVGKDGFAPRQFTARGKRLSFSTGIVFLSFVAGILVLAFNADVHNLIPLYSVGVFLSFTLSQSGMVIHWKNSNENGWEKRAVINGFGAIIAAVTTIILIYEKFAEGAWIVIILIPMLTLAMTAIKKHYNKVADNLRITEDELADIHLDNPFVHVMIVPIASLNRATINALHYARSITPDVIALNISSDKEAIEKLKRKWELLNTDILLVAKYSPYRAVVTPLIDCIGKIADAAGENERISVILPEFKIDEWWGEALHNHTGFFIRETLLRNKNIIISTYPYHMYKK
ncbi:APC family permease [Clostridium sp. PL3]|uniref:APC family permease n=1 Tax=Clostridium thailandense TaxID=2794346 RepID=A0A949TXV9_9CLOT|nr:APC family permease [Clostridium thailandense]MBV7272504.1 APC family permease [Clostridium thailandense]